MDKKVLLRVLITSAVAFAAASCGSQQMSDLASANGNVQSKSLNDLSSEQKDESVLAFALACSPVDSGSAVRSARFFFDGSKAELRLDANGGERLHSAINSQLVSVTDSSIDVSWPLDQVSFKAALAQGRVFKAELKQEGVALALNCYKVVTAERDSDEFSMVCTPIAADQAYAEGLNLNVRDVILSWEDRGLEMIVNPTSESLIYDFERADGVQVSEQSVSAFWNLEQATFSATSQDGIQFDGQLAYEGQSAIPLICWKL